MNRKRLTRVFFNRPTLQVARELLGKFLVRRIGKKKIIAMITETEAYCGPNDIASHASRGRTPRTEVMFGPPGHAYVYMIYGMYHCLNIVTEQKGYPAAVLIRGVRCQVPGSSPIFQNNLKPETCNLKPEINGPGKLCRHFQIDRNLNKEDLITSKTLWLEDWGVKVKSNQAKRLPRVGIDYAGEYKNKPWRLCLYL